MSLNNPNTTTKFESQEDTDNTAQGAAQAQAAEAHAEKVDTEVQKDAAVKDAAEVKASTVTGETAAQGAVATVTGSRGLANPNTNAGDMLAGSNVLAKMNGKLRVTWEDFKTINANLGQFQLKSDDGLQIGAEIQLHLASTQEQ